MRSNNQLSVLLKIVAVAFVATVSLTETAIPQFPEQRLIPLIEPTTPLNPEEYDDADTGNPPNKYHLEWEEKKNQSPPLKKFVVYGRAGSKERAGIAFTVDYRPIIHARTPEFAPAPTNWEKKAPNTSRMPDLESFFEFGGTLELLTTDTTLEKYDIVMSELMWGLDTGINTSQFDPKFTIQIPDPDNSEQKLPVEVPELRNQEVQWVELYNTKNEDITAELYLLFTPFESHPDRQAIRYNQHNMKWEGVRIDAPSAEYIVLDAVSTLLFGRWQLPGKSGRRPRTTLVSAYRNIDYEIVENRNLYPGMHNWQESLSAPIRGVGWRHPTLDVEIRS